MGAKPKKSSKMFTLLSTRCHKCILSHTRDIFHSCFKAWTLNPKHTLPFFHARTNSPKSDSVMSCCLTCMQHLCEPFLKGERKRERLSNELCLKSRPIATLPVIIERKLSIKYKSTVINLSVTEEGRRGWGFQHSSACSCCYFTSAPQRDKRLQKSVGQITSVCISLGQVNSCCSSVWWKEEFGLGGNIYMRKQFYPPSIFWVCLHLI